MPLRFALILILTLAVPVAEPLKAADPLRPAIQAMPLEIEEVRLFGRWTLEERGGVFRGIVTRSGSDPRTARLFLQWLAIDEEKKATLHATTEIIEFQELATNIVEFRHEQDPEGIVIFIDTIDSDDQNENTYELFLKTPEEYEFSLATN